MSPPLLLLLLFSILTPALMLEFRYHNNREMEQYLLQTNASNPDITHLYSIGQSVKGDAFFLFLNFPSSKLGDELRPLPSAVQDRLVFLPACKCPQLRAADYFTYTPTRSQW